jgi:predicted transcriptional regulator
MNGLIKEKGWVQTQIFSARGKKKKGKQLPLPLFQMYQMA